MWAMRSEGICNRRVQVLSSDPVAVEALVGAQSGEWGDESRV